MKRQLSSTQRCVSPPARRRKISSPSLQVQDIEAKEIGRTTPSAPGQTEARRLPYLIRLYSWNVNGVNPLIQRQISFSSNATSTPTPLRTFLCRHNFPHILCLQEVKISSKDIQTQRNLILAANASAQPGEPLYDASYSLPRDKYNATGFGGKVHGVATLIRKDLDHLVTRTWIPDWDLEGRVLIHEFGCGLVVVNGYWVNGTSNPYRDSSTGEVVGTRHEFKLRHHERMLDLCLNFERGEKSIILAGDMNIARERMDGHPNLRTTPVQHVKNRADFNEKFFNSQHGLLGVDVFRSMHGGRRKYTYHPRGVGWGTSCDRVDLIITSRRLFSNGAVTATEICDNPGDRGHSDHVPLWAEVDLSRIPSYTDQSSLSS